MYRLVACITPALIFLVVVACAPTADERCGGPTKWEDKTCMPVEEPEAGVALPEGLDEACLTMGLETECVEYEAEYCLVEPGKPEGYCTMADCTVEPDDCPPGFKCCDITVKGIVNFCAKTKDFFSMGSMCATK